MICPHCGSKDTKKNGFSFSGDQRFQCKKCNKWFYDRTGEYGQSKENTSYQEDGENIHVVVTSRRMLTKEEVIEQFKVDTDQWEVDSFEVNTSEGYRKDRKVKWEVENGTVLYGSVKDTGRMLIVPLYHIKVKFHRKSEEIRVRSAVEDMKEDAVNYAPKYPKIKYPKVRNPHLYEIDLPDIHFGRLTWAEESGKDYDIQIAEKYVKSVLTQLLEYSKVFETSKILLPIGNDFFNVNSKTNTTVSGTPQQEDTRWSKTFRRGRELVVWMVEACSAIAPTDVLIIKGNHDEEKIFYLGDALFSWFHADPNVHVDNSATARKYYPYGKNLIGFTHGDREKIATLQSIMPGEVPELWAASTYREWHLGHVHRKFEVLEENGVVVRQLRSLVEHDAWTYQTGYTKALGAGESFVWDKDGLVAQFTATPKEMNDK